MTRIIPFTELATSDLIIDAIYEGSDDGQLAGEPISKLLPGSGNMGGFRIAGREERKSWVVLFTTGEDKDWPDTLDTNTGKFMYFGDNKTPGHELHDTRAGGNKILRKAFASLHSERRDDIPPFLVFKKHPTEKGARSVQFKGLAVPGFPGIPATEDLVAVWKATAAQRFQNYRAIFSILNAPVVPRAWLQELSSGRLDSENAPPTWIDWVKRGKLKPLAAEPTTIIRTVDQQAPDSTIKAEILECVWRHFESTPIAFETFAAKIYQMSDSRVVIDEVTRGTIDGGRDAIGRYLLGLPEDPVYAEFSLEAKCYRPGLKGATPNTVGVKEVSRLISRIRHRQYGVLITTSAIAKQAYEEVRQDRHPIIFISGKDIAEILIRSGYNSPDKVRAWLGAEFPVPREEK